MAARTLTLGVAVLLLAGCGGRLYTTEEAHTALAEAGVSSAAVFPPPHEGCAVPGFVSLRRAVELSFDTSRSKPGMLLAQHGSIDVFCDRYQASRFVDGAGTAHLGLHVERRANVVLIEGRRDPALEAAFEKFSR